MLQNGEFKFNEASGRLTINLDTTTPIGPSRSGKTTLLASPHGNVQIAPGLYASVNVYRKGA